MKIVFYVFAGVIGLFALLAFLRGVEMLAFGDGFQIINFLIASVGFILCFLWVKRARNAK